MRDELYLWKHEIIVEASVTFEEAKSMLTDGTNVRLGHHLLDNPKIAIDFTSALSAWKAALDMSAKILEKRKSVLDHLGRVRKCIGTLMGFGTVASSIHPLSSLVFSSVNAVYKFLEVQEQSHEIVLDLVQNMAFTVEYVMGVKQFAQIKQLKKAIEDVWPLLEETTEFVRDYSSSTELGNAFRALISPSIGSKIDCMNKKYTRFNSSTIEALVLRHWPRWQSFGRLLVC